MSASAKLAYVPKRGRPSPSQIAAIGEAILVTARRLFFEEGYDVVAMEGVAAAVGISKGTLYARYPSKEALFEAVVERSVREWSEESRKDDFQLTDDIAVRLRYRARSVARSLFNPDVRAFQRLIFAHGERFPILGKSMYEVGYLHIIGLITGDIEAAAVRDQRPVRDADAVARHLVSAIVGWQMQEGAMRRLAVEDLEAFAVRAADLVLAARDAW